MKLDIQLPHLEALLNRMGATRSSWTPDQQPLPPRAEIQEELFDAKSDPQELTDLSEQRSEDLESMRSRARELAETEPVWGKPETRELDELELNQLRALGYELE